MTLQTPLPRRSLPSDGDSDLSESERLRRAFLSTCLSFSISVSLSRRVRTACTSSCSFPISCNHGSSLNVYQTGIKDFHIPTASLIEACWLHLQWEIPMPITHCRHGNRLQWTLMSIKWYFSALFVFIQTLSFQMFHLLFSLTRNNTQDGQFIRCM